MNQNLKVNSNSDAGTINNYVLYPTRYIMLALFAMAELCNTAVYATCNPLANELIILYNSTADVVTLSATLYLFMHPIFTFPASFLIMKYGNASSIKLGGILTLIGVGSRCFVEKSFVYVLIGQTFSGIGRPFILNAQASVAQEWFPIQERTKLMTFLNFMVTFSGILGYIIPPIFFSNYNISKTNKTPELIDEGRHRFDVLVISQAIFCAIFIVPLILFYKSNPPSPPGPKIQSKGPAIGFKDSIVKMFKDVKFIMIFLSFTLYYGTYKGYGVALVFLLKPFGYGKSEIAYLSCMPVLGGFVSSLFIPGIYKNWGKYKPLIILLQFSTIITFYQFISGCFIQNFWVMMIVAVVQGFFILPAIPLLLEWGCAQIFPLNDSFCIGLMYSGATMGSSLIAQIIVKAINGENVSQWGAFGGISIVCGLYLSSILSIAFINELNKKEELRKSLVADEDTIK